MSSLDDAMRHVRRPGSVEHLMAVARLTAMRSTCLRAQVGCVIADESLERYVVGYNGGPRGGVNTCRRPDAGNCGCLHAEMNAVAKAGRGNKVAFITPFSPCEMCATLLVNSGVIRVYFDEEYRLPGGLDVLDEVGIPYQQLSPKASDFIAD